MQNSPSASAPSPDASHVHITDQHIASAANAYHRQQVEKSHLSRWDTQEKEIGEEGEERDERDVRKKQVWVWFIGRGGWICGVWLLMSSVLDFSGEIFVLVCCSTITHFPRSLCVLIYA